MMIPLSTGLAALMIISGYRRAIAAVAFGCVIVDVCKGTYASVRPYSHTYGNYGIRLQTWTRVIVNRCVGKIIARDLSLVAS